MNQAQTSTLDGHEDPYWEKIAPPGFRFFTNLFPPHDPFDQPTVDERVEQIESRYGAANVYVSGEVYDISGNPVGGPDARAVFVREDAPASL